MGIAKKLEQWIQSGELTLQVSQTVQPLGEPFLDSEWIANREDIFNFFREAITTVIRHAQPPHGGATQVGVRLWREASQCTFWLRMMGLSLTQPHPNQAVMELN